MAAGLGVTLANLPALQVALTRELGSRVSSDITEPELLIELFLDASQEGLDLIDALDQIFAELQALEPFGHGHPRPLIGLMNLQPHQVKLVPSQNGRHLGWELRAAKGWRSIRKLWMWNEGSRLEELLKMGRQGGWDLACVLEPATGGQAAWSGVIKAWQGAGAWQSTVVEPMDLRLTDCRGQGIDQVAVSAQTALYAGQIPDPAPDLVLVQWPLFPEDLGDLLQAVRPQHVILLGKGMDAHQLAQQIPAFVQAWEQGIRRTADLVATGIPRSLVDRCLQSQDTQSTIGLLLLALLQEGQAFHEWLSTAPSAEIRKLCRRFLRVS